MTIEEEQCEKTLCQECVYFTVKADAPQGGFLEFSCKINALKKEDVHPFWKVAICDKGKKRSKQ